MTWHEEVYALRRQLNNLLRRNNEGVLRSVTPHAASTKADVTDTFSFMSIEDISPFAPIPPELLIHKHEVQLSDRIGKKKKKKKTRCMIHTLLVTCDMKVHYVHGV